jgi:hypothetical protein
MPVNSPTMRMSFPSGDHVRGAAPARYGNPNLYSLQEIATTAARSHNDNVKAPYPT